MPKSETRYCNECRRHTEHLIGPGGNFGCMDTGHPRKVGPMACFLCGRQTEHDGYCKRCDVFTEEIKR